MLSQELIESKQKFAKLFNIGMIRNILPLDASIVINHFGLSPEIHVAQNCSTSTASIGKCGRRYKIVINREFLMEYIHDSSSATHLILHEIYHKIHNDFSRPAPLIPVTNDHSMIEYYSVLSNIVADIVINSAMRRSFEETPEYIRKLYSSGGISSILAPPEVLLKTDKYTVAKMDRNVLSTKMMSYFRRMLEQFVPNTILRRRRMKFDLNKHLLTTAEKNFFKNVEPLSATLTHLYLDAWLGDLSYDAIFIRLDKFFTELFYDKEVLEMIFNMRHVWNIRFIGDHSGSRAIFFNRYGHNMLIRYMINGFSPNNERLTRALHMIKKALYEGMAREILTETFFAQRTVVPSASRTEAYFLSSGYSPPFYTNTVYMKHSESNRLHIYIDVSGSILRELEDIYAIIKGIREYISECLYLFSTQVETITLNEIEEGIAETTFGTDFDCVAEHALKHGFRKILIITDGHGPMSEDLVNQLTTKCEVYALFFGSANTNGVIGEICGGEKYRGVRWWSL